MKQPGFRFNTARLKRSEKITLLEKNERHRNAGFTRNNPMFFGTKSMIVSVFVDVTEKPIFKKKHFSRDINRCPEESFLKTSQQQATKARNHPNST